MTYKVPVKNGMDLIQEKHDSVQITEANSFQDGIKEKFKQLHHWEGTMF